MKEKLITISELAQKLKLINKKTGKPQTHTLRFWEKKFTQIKPTKLNSNRRLYSIKQVKLIVFINYLLKDKGLSIENAKNILKKNINNLDDYHLTSIKTDYIKKNLKEKSLKILNKIKKFKKDGKKNTY
jgi:DNA-binding transcriptional MerR regulator|tara:strand:+ start:6097 stop:6483 length:387 start_codon:yes stop_codon:yes gene_type:complete